MLFNLEIQILHKRSHWFSNMVYFVCYRSTRHAKEAEYKENLQSHETGSLNISDVLYKFYIATNNCVRKEPI